MADAADRFRELGAARRGALTDGPAADGAAADAWSAFEESGALSVTTGRRLREEILEAGGSRDALENFIAFRGREPRIDALLRHQGMA